MLRKKAGVAEGGQTRGRKKRNATGWAVGAGEAVSLAVSCCISAVEAVPTGPPRQGNSSPAAVCHQTEPNGSCAGCHDNWNRAYDPFHFLNINVFHTVYVTPWKPNVEQERLHKNEQNRE